MVLRDCHFPIIGAEEILQLFHSIKSCLLASITDLETRTKMNSVLNSCRGTISSSKLHNTCTHGKSKVPTGTLNVSSVDQNLHRSNSFEVLTIVSGVAAANLVVANAAEALSMENIMEKYGYFSSSQEGAASVYTLADGSVGDWFGGFLYSAGQQANEAVQDQLSALSFTSLAVIFGAGLVTSLSPCTLSRILGLAEIIQELLAQGKAKQRTVIGNSVAFSLGLATTLAILGISASFAGKAYGQIGQGLPVVASGLAVIMGLNLLEIIELQLPSFFNNFDPRAAAANFPSGVQAYLAGLTFALAASPCSTPVLATLLGYVAASKDPVIGGSLLLTYTTGYVAPLLLAASFAGALQPAFIPQILSMDQPNEWCSPLRRWYLYSVGPAFPSDNGLTTQEWKTCKCP
ncbi:unnamed protein product [Camellia sinensis]